MSITPDAEGTIYDIAPQEWGSPATCDECGWTDEEGQEWCGNCGCCADHCQDYEGCNPECLDGHNEDCEGPVEYHQNPYSYSFRAWPRCNKHYLDYVARQQDIAQRYPHNAPSDFDPMYAGERWEDD